ncbi:MAG: type transport system ATP-binding protein, partial [Baekduia sp.]|nr:type transport system ATP-binding protein [Baekduia sp.]
MPMTNRPPAVYVDDVAKSFSIPRERVHTLKERVLHPLRRAAHDDFEALRGVSFGVEAGEFFGIVGRNGSGKSTLLKCLAGIYRTDRGAIYVDGRVSTFIELGVGFNPDLAAYDNVMLNATMLGLSTKEARKRYDRIIDFAELHDFTDLKIKNYSSGMQVRLAFAVMVQSGADVMLIDEVLAVGDAAFQQRCLDEFHRLRSEGRTIVLVTHDMATVERFCHRALLLTDGNIELIGDPQEVGRLYLQRNFEGFHGAQPEPAAVAEDADSEEPPPRATIADVWVEDGAGGRVDTVRHGDRLR